MWVNELINKVIEFSVRPITVAPVYFFLLYLLITIPDAFSFLQGNIFPLIISVILASGFFFCYIMLLPVVLLPSLSRKIYKSILLLVGIVYFSLNIYSIIIYNRSINAFSPEIFAAVFATNTAETYEFMQMYFEYGKLFLILLIITLLLILFYSLNRLKWHIRGGAKITLFFFLLVSIFVSVIKFDRVSAMNIYRLFVSPQVYDLRDYRQSPTIVKCEDTPENIVLIIGESFSKYHSSLYGYEKQTNPLLERMVADSALYVYKNVESLALSTIPCIKSIMSSYRNEYADSVAWYRCLNIIDVMKHSGFKTLWTSNQSKRGMNDNEIGRYAELCDVELFVGNKYAGLHRTNLDEELFPYIDSCLCSSGCPNFIIVHLMGSHAVYNKRYPAEYERFTIGDYENACKELSDDKKQLVAEYDNSVLYNDSVVSEIMNRFADEEAVVFYFSDHGEDVFRRNNVYIGHGNLESADIINKIPFMVYTTDKFRERFPQMEERIKQAVDTPYRTDSVMYTIMDVAGIDSVNGVSYKHKSLFK